MGDVDSSAEEESDAEGGSSEEEEDPTKIIEEEEVGLAGLISTRLRQMLFHMHCHNSGLLPVGGVP